MNVAGTIKRALSPLVYGEGFAIIPPKINPSWPQRKFLRQMLRRLHVDCVFDVGANVGQYASELRNLGYSGTILSFEPDPACFAALSAKSADDRHWHVYNVALGRTPGTAQFNVMVVPLFNSFREPSTRDTKLYAEPNKVKETIAVEIEVLRDIFPRLQAEHGFTTPFLKMDTQGFDLEVFAGAGDVIGSFAGLQSEVAVQKIYEDAPDWKDAITSYEAGGLTLAGMFAVNADREQLIEFDCYFVQGDSDGDDPENPAAPQ
jgi:FkbM family methyltransferase